MPLYYVNHYNEPLYGPLKNASNFTHNNIQLFLKLNSRNGSGSASVSEFCSMLRLVVGPTVNKRVLYRAVSTLDSNGDRQISLEELMLFVYRLWRSQLDSLADDLASMTSGDAKRADRVLKERDDIKDAVKKNFSRAWRDRVEREGQAVSGPFYSILAHMGVGRTDRQDTSIHDGTRRNEHDDSQQKQRVRSLGCSPADSHSPNSTQSSRSQPIRITTATRPLSASSTHASSTGHNGLLRFKIKLAPEMGGILGGGSVPHRKGVTLSMPKVRNLNDDCDLTSEMASSSYKTYY